jgi:hypothetical protein
VKVYDVQSIAVSVPAGRAFEFIADSRELVGWTHAIAAVNGSRARLRTPAGEVEIELQVVTDKAARTVDWYMTFPDGSTATAFSRVMPLGKDRCLYSFALTPPPGPLELLEGTLEQQSRTLSEELVRLKELLESRR